MKQVKIAENGDLVLADTGKGVYCYRTAADRSQSLLAAAIIGVMAEGHVEQFRAHFQQMTGHCTSRCAAFEADEKNHRVYCSAIQDGIGDLEPEKRQ